MKYNSAKVLSIAIALSPILCVYWFPGFSLIPVGDIFLIISSIILLITKSINRVRVLPISVFLFVYILIRQLFTQSTFGEISSTAHILLYYLFISFILVSLKNSEIYINPIVVIGVLSSVFIVFQTIIYYLFHYYIPGTIPFLKHQDFLDAFANSVNSNLFNLTFRPRSFFTEPSTFSAYVAIALAFTLPNFWKNRKSTIETIIMSIGLLVSLSSTGIVLCIVMWLVYIISLNKERISNNKFLISMLILIVAIFVICYLITTDWYAFFVDHTLGNGLQNRIGQFARGINENNGLLEVLFGNGRIDLGYYLPEIISIYVYWGILGYFLFIVFSFQMFSIKDLTGKLLMIICIGLLIIGGYLTVSYTPMIFYCIYKIKCLNSENI